MLDFSYLMIAIFVIGYFFIAVEHFTHINKATCALLMAIFCWVIQFASKGFTTAENHEFLGHHLSNISQIIFFLLGAIIIVEVIDSYKGFTVVSDLFHTKSKRKLLWMTGFLTFFLSSVLDNLTTTIVMVSLLRKIIPENEDRLIIGGAIVIAANAGGAWTPIGDVTTTMLWIGGQITSFSIMKGLFLPSIGCLIASLIIFHFMLKGNFSEKSLSYDKGHPSNLSTLIFCLGIGALIFVPIFKSLTGLPPFMGILLGLGVIWLVTDIISIMYPEGDHPKVQTVMSKVDISGIFFFLGILLCINALETAGILENFARWLDKQIPNVNIYATLLGLVSAIIDNVPLVAASMGMYDLSQYPTDSSFWKLVAYCAGTGGSILVIGSAAGIVFMGLEKKVDFFWYLKRISFPALVGYFAGIIIYLLI